MPVSVSVGVGVRVCVCVGFCFSSFSVFFISRYFPSFDHLFYLCCRFSHQVELLAPFLFGCCLRLVVPPSPPPSWCCLLLSLCSFLFWWVVLLTSLLLSVAAFPPLPFWVVLPSSLLLPPLGGAAFSLPPCGWCCFPNLLSGGASFSASFVVLPSPLPFGWCCLTCSSSSSSSSCGWCCRSPFFGMK